MKFLAACKSFLGHVFRDRTTTLEQFILANNPQNTMQVEQLERMYYAREQRKQMI